MREITVCAECGCKDIEYLGQGKCFCPECNKETKSKDIFVETPYERTRAAIYASGNRWAIENYNATHNN